MLIENDLARSIALDGDWQFSLGEGAPWGHIQVPGCWEAQGYLKSVEGPARYRRSMLVPDAWSGCTILAQFEAVSYACTLRVNEVEVGGHRGIWTPFQVDLTSTLVPGRVNQLELEVYKPGTRYPLRGSLAGFIPDISTAFGGIWQPVKLIALQSGLKDLWIRGDLDRSSIHVSCQAWQMQGALNRACWQIEVFRGEDQVACQTVDCAADGLLDTYFLISGAERWEPAHPALYTVRVSLFEGRRLAARLQKRAGFRRLSAQGHQLLFNGQPCLLRGVLSWGWNPDQIAPAFSPDQARAEIRRVRSMGFNLIKLCLFVPNPVFFDIADEEGMFLWLEYPLWLPEVTADFSRHLPGEYAEITRLARQHPSLVLYSLGCELSQAIDQDLLTALNGAVRQELAGAGDACDVLVCDNSGSGESYGGLDMDFADFTDYHPYYDLQYLEPLLDHWRRDWQPPRPWIFGEFCDADTFRDLCEIVAANGGSKPWWLTSDNPVSAWRVEAQALLEAEQRLEGADLGFSPQELVKISYAQAAVMRKYTLELIRRRAGVGGYVITGLRDTPISTSGIWDDLLRPKWAEEEFRAFNGEAVLCLDGMRRRRWHSGGDRPDRLDLYNFWAGEEARWEVILSQSTQAPGLSKAFLDWTLADPAGSPVAAAVQEVRPTARMNSPCPVGRIACKLPAVQTPLELRLKVCLSTGEQAVENQWPIWVYPKPRSVHRRLGIYDPAGCLEDVDWLYDVPRLPVQLSLRQLGSMDIILSTTWGQVLEKLVRQGGKVLLLQQGAKPLPVHRRPFWREATHLFIPHPIWDVFPQRGFADLQFFGLVGDLFFDPLGLRQALPEDAILKPVMRRLDARQYHLSETMFEAALGRGLLLGCALRLQGGAGAQPEGWARNVAGSAMLAAILSYLEKGFL